MVARVDLARRCHGQTAGCRKGKVSAGIKHGAGGHRDVAKAGGDIDCTGDRCAAKDHVV